MAAIGTLMYLKLYQTTRLWTDRSKLKALADDNLHEVQIMIQVHDWIENILGKGENTGYQYVLYFSQCFEKLSCLRLLYDQTVFVKAELGNQGYAMLKMENCRQKPFPS